MCIAQRIEDGVHCDFLMGLQGYGFFQLFQEQLFLEIPSHISPLLRTLKSFSIFSSAITICLMGRSDLSSSAFHLWCSCFLFMSHVDLSSSYVHLWLSLQTLLPFFSQSRRLPNAYIIEWFFWLFLLAFSQNNSSWPHITQMISIIQHIFWFLFSTQE